MPTVVSPGVFIQERDDSLYAPSISPAVIGIVGTATKGPTDEATLVTSEGQFTEEFGRPRSKDFGMHAVIEALKSVNLVYFVRIAGASAAAGLIDVSDAGSGPTAASIGPSSNGEPFNLLGANSVESPEGTRTATARFTYDNGAGLQSDVDADVAATQATLTSGNAETYDFDTIAGGATPVSMRIAIDGGPLQTITFSPSDASVYTAVTAEEVVTVIQNQLEGGGARGTTSVTIFSDKYGTDSNIQVQAPASGPNMNDATNGLNFSTVSTPGTGDVADLGAVTGAELKAAIEADIADLSVTVGTGGEITVATATTGATRSLLIVTATGPNTIVGAGTGQVNLTPLDTTVNGTSSTAAAPTIRFSAKTDGSHSSRIKVRISDSTAIVGTKKVEVLLDDAVVEIFDKLVKTAGTPPTGSFNMITTINSGTTDGEFTASDLITASDLNASGENPVNGTVTLSAGNNGDDWTSGTVIGTIVGSVRTGMQIFRDPDQVFINLLSTPGISYSSVISEGIDICETRADCLYIADCPSNLDAADVVKWHNGDNSITANVDQEDSTETNFTTFNSSYAALYWPFVTIFDKFSDTNIRVPPSAIVLRTIANTDRVSDPWFAPAGPNRTQATSVLDLDFNPDQGERDLMQLPGNAVNPIASIAGVGVVIMGQKTLQRKPSALDRVNVRRLLLAIEKVIANVVFFLIFEPNDPIMWGRFVNLVTPFLNDVKSRRGVFDFKVIADSSTTTDVLIDQNTFLGKIFLQPTKAAEKLIVSFNITPSGTDFTEFTG